MTSHPENMPCLARLKAMDIQPGQNDKARRLPFHALAKPVCPVKVPEEQSQAHLDVQSAEGTCFGSHTGIADYSCLAEICR